MLSTFNKIFAIINYHDFHFFKTILDDMNSAILHLNEIIRLNQELHFKIGT